MVMMRFQGIDYLSRVQDWSQAWGRVIVQLQERLVCKTVLTECVCMHVIVCVFISACVCVFVEIAQFIKAQQFIYKSAPAYYS